MPVKPKVEVEIIIRGPRKSGKSVLADLIAKVLQKGGHKCQLQELTIDENGVVVNVRKRGVFPGRIKSYISVEEFVSLCLGSPQTYIISAENQRYTPY